MADLAILAHDAAAAAAIVERTNMTSKDPDNFEAFEAVHQKAVDLMTAMQCRIAQELGLFDEHGEPRPDLDEDRWGDIPGLLWSGDASEADIAKAISLGKD
jgi:hypothetical protein